MILILQRFRLKRLRQPFTSAWYYAVLACIGGWFAVVDAAPAWTQSAVEQRKTRWVLNAEATACKLTRSAGPDGDPLFEISGSADGRPITIMLVSPAWKKNLVRSRQPAEIVLLPSGQRVAADAYPLSATLISGNGIALYQVEESFSDTFWKAQGFAVEIKGRRIAEVAFTGADRAGKALASCREDLLRSWGVDPVLHASLLKRPKPAGNGSIGQWLRDADYPIEAMRRGAAGTVVIRFTVNVDGRVSDCAIAISSGDQALDRTSCAIIVKRGRYEPAVKPDGTLVAAVTATTVKWSLPSG